MELQLSEFYKAIRQDSTGSRPAKYRQYIVLRDCLCPFVRAHPHHRVSHARTRSWVANLSRARAEYAGMCCWWLQQLQHLSLVAVKKVLFFPPHLKWNKCNEGNIFIQYIDRDERSTHRSAWPSNAKQDAPGFKQFKHTALRLKSLLSNTSPSGP